MSWSEIQALFDGQGLVFWTAVTAVAVGLTLLLVSIYFQGRKVFAQTKWGRHRTDTSSSPKRAAAPIGQITVTADGYSAAGVLPKTLVPEVVPGSGLRLDDVCQRLRAASAHLERIHTAMGDSGNQVMRSPESSLKSPLAEVDYIYRTNSAWQS